MKQFLFIMFFSIAIECSAQQNFWQQSSLNNGNILSLTYKSGLVFAGTDGGGVYLTSNKGNSWGQVISGLVDLWIPSITVNQNGTVYAGSDSGMVRLNNNGNSWTRINTGLGTPAVHALAINSTQEVFAGTSSGVFKSLNNGDSWEEKNSGLTSKSLQSLTITGNNVVFAGTWGGGVFRSTDNGESWTHINSGMSSNNIYSLACNSNNEVFAGTNGGIFRSSDNGEHWTGLNTGLTNEYIYSLTINEDGILFAGTYGSGVFRSANSITSVASISEIISSYKLFQNYPNPFNPTTKLKIQIAKHGPVSVKVYNILGKEAATLLNKEMSPGEYELTFNARNLPSGVYFYELRSQNFNQTKKMILLR